jgi:hypothetical protein
LKKRSRNKRASGRNDIFTLRIRELVPTSIDTANRSCYVLFLWRHPIQAKGDIRALYEVRSFRNAEEILIASFPERWEEICAALLAFRLTKGDLLKPGGNEAELTRRFKGLLRERGWEERRLTADLIVKTYSGRSAKPVSEDRLERFIDGHNVDFVKGRVALEWEWNSKDQTFDRDLIAFRAFFESNVIDVGVIVTRSVRLNQVFRELGLMAKYGASTTWIGKLIPRVEAGRNGGCPILAIGMTPEIIVNLDGGDVAKHQ